MAQIQSHNRKCPTPIALTEFNTTQNTFKTLTAALVNAQTLMAVVELPPHSATDIRITSTANSQP